MTSHRVWVGGLPSGVQEEALEECFHKCGEICEILVKQNKTDTFAFIAFKERRAYEKAKDMDQCRFFGRPIKVNDVINSRDDRDRGPPVRTRQDDTGWSNTGGKGSSKGAPWRSRDDRRDDWDEDRGYDRRDDRRGKDGDRSRGGYERERDYDHSGYDRGKGDRDGYDRTRNRDRDGDHSGGNERDQGGRDRERDRGARESDHAYEDRGKGRSGSRSRGGDLTRRDTGGGTDNDKRVWIGGLPKDVSEEEIERVFSQCGKVVEVLIRSSQRDIFAFVQYATAGQARDAIANLDHTTELGNPIKVARASGTAKEDKGKGRGKDQSGQDRGSRGRDQDSSPELRRRVRSRSPPRARYRAALEGLPIDMERDELYDVCLDYGRVLDHELWREGDANHAWVEYGTRNETIAAVEALHERRVKGWDRRIKAFLEEKDA